MSIENTLAERGSRYGDFTDHAEIAQALQKVMQKAERVSPVSGNRARVLSWECINPVARQALTVIADKIARILSGDPNYADNWHDIQGYAKLVEDRLPQPDEAALPADTGCPHCGASELHQLTCPTQPVITVNLGTAPSPPIDPADVDISDEEYPSDLPPDRWKEGDVVVALHNCDGQFSRLKRYTLRSANEYNTVKVVADDQNKKNGWGEHNFRFHSRPTK